MKNILIACLLAGMSIPAMADDNACPYSAEEVQSLLDRAVALEEYKLVRVLNMCGSEDATSADLEMLSNAERILGQAPERFEAREQAREEARQERLKAEQDRRLMQQKDLRVEAIKIVEANYSERQKTYTAGAVQRTQLNTTTMVEQNKIIIYQNERIIELLERMTEDES